MSIDLDELERLANAATPGRWVTFGDRRAIDPKIVRWLGMHKPETQGKKNAEYIAAARPEVILPLIAEVRQLREELLAEREAATAKERERCAKIAEEVRLWPTSFTKHKVGETIAAAIRRGDAP